MDAKEMESARQEERELWLLVIGALLAGSKPVAAEVESRLDTSDAPCEKLVGLLASVKNGDREHAWKWLELLGVQKLEKRTCMQGIIAELKQRIAKRAVVRTAKSLQMSSLLDDPAAWLEYVESQLKLVRGKL